MLDIREAVSSTDLLGIERIRILESGNLYIRIILVNKLASLHRV